MRRIPSINLISLTAISAAALLGACAAMDRDTMFENNGPPPASAPARSGATPAASAPAPQAQAAPAAPQQQAQVTPTPAPAQAAPTTFTDAQLQSFVTASRQIEPLNRQVASATPEQRTAPATQIRGVLTQNNLDGATYNAIATRAQTDPALASRIAALQTNPNG